MNNVLVIFTRSHGRPSKMVVVKGQCTRLTKNHLKYTIDTTPSLCELPFLHMFWTDCQVWCSIGMVACTWFGDMSVLEKIYVLEGCLCQRYGYI